MQPEFHFGERKVGPAHPPLVVAEAGINHNGSLEKAKQLVDSAVSVGCEAIKFQTHIADKEMIKTDLTPGKLSKKSIWQIIKEVELSEDDERQLQRYCREKGIYFFSTPFSREAADRLDDLDVPVFKISAAECDNLPFLEHVASLKRPIILSTGMNDFASVRRSVGVIKKYGGEVALLHCVSIYPTPYPKAGLACVTQMREEFPDLVIGLSDHTENVWTCLGAVALGAAILEKHFTVSRDWVGPDIPFSIDQQEMKNMVDGAEAIWQGRGGEKKALDEEQPFKDFACASVVTIAAIKRGEGFTNENTWVKRPGKGGIPAAELDTVIGKTAARDLESDQQLSRQDVE